MRSAVFDDFVLAGLTIPGPKCSDTGVTLNSDGFTLAYTNRQAVSAYRGYVAVSGIDMELLTDTQPTSIGDSDVTATNQPRLAMFMSHQATAFGTAFQQSGFTFGAYDGTNTAAVHGWSADAVNADAHSDCSSTEYVLPMNFNNAGVITQNGTASASFEDENVVRTSWSVTDGNARVFSVIVLSGGVAPPDGGGSFLLRRRRRF
jgi:hypothetical protein